jgi:tetratricopeptide (TPR) repeat protein
MKLRNYLRCCIKAFTGVLPAFAAALCFVPRLAVAYDFVPTEADWAAWPRYCQARYASTNIGGQSEWAGTVPATEVANWRARVGVETFLHVHHYCAGAALFNQSRTTGDKQRKLFLLNLARGEVIYTYSRAPTGCALCGEIASTLARIEASAGNTTDAIAVLKTAIGSNPEDPRPYASLAMIYRDLKMFKESIQVLVDCNKVLGGESAEVHYNLGLLYLEVGDIDSALAHAHLAYARSHPLPGLRNRLQALGRWTPQAASVALPAAEIISP